MKHSIAWYQEQFINMKIDYLTRRHRADNELLVFLLESGPYRVTYMRVDQAGVTVCAEDRVRLYASWSGGDRFERMLDAMGWLALPVPLVPPQVKWDEYSAWEVEPPLLLEAADHGQADD